MMNDLANANLMPLVVLTGMDKTDSKKKMDNDADKIAPTILTNIKDSTNTKKTMPVFIEFTPEYKRENGISNEIDLLKTPKTDEFSKTFGEPQVLAAFKAPSPQQAKEFIILLPIILEAGNQALNKIFDILDTWNERKPKSGHEEVQKAQAIILPEGLAEALAVSGINPEA